MKAFLAALVAMAVIAGRVACDDRIGNHQVLARQDCPSVAIDIPAGERQPEELDIYEIAAVAVVDVEDANAVARVERIAGRGIVGVDRQAAR